MSRACQIFPVAPRNSIGHLSAIAFQQELS